MRALLAHHAAEQRVEQLEFVLAAHERRLGWLALLASRRRGGQADGLERRHGLRLALQLQRLELAVLDRAARRAYGALADGDGPDLGGRLQTGGDVDGVADH